ncbi:DUF2283 domain-containing protein [Patescibacteria group bacterium]|nr:DUF2283 domain-containing protein [Patescibacteria group bacterium]
MRNKLKKPKISYDMEADVLRVEISKKPIDYAREMGNIIVHFTQKGLPVYLEILEAKKFLTKTGQILEKAKMPKFVGKPA